MKTIYKYVLGTTDEQIVSIPKFRRFLSCQMQGGSICVWYEVVVDGNFEPVTFYVVGTGNQCGKAFGKKHVGSVQHGSFVWHVFAEQF